MLIAGRIFGLIILAIIVALTLAALQRAKKGQVREVRPLAGIEGIKEAVARCTETGRPLFFTTGHGGGGLYTSRGPEHMAGVSVLGFAARQCARLGAKLVSCWPFSEMVPVAEDVISNAYLVEGKSSEVPRDSVRFLSTYALAFKMGWVGQVYRERAGGIIAVGAVWPSDALQMTEPGVVIGALQIGGAATMDTLSQLALTCDYLFIGEELYSAGAFASEDPIQLGVMFASDIVKLGVVLLIIFGFLLTTGAVKIDPLFGL